MNEDETCERKLYIKLIYNIKKILIKIKKKKKKNVIK